MTIFCTWKRSQYQKHISNRNHCNQPQGLKVRLFDMTGSKFLNEALTGIHSIFKSKKKRIEYKYWPFERDFRKGQATKICESAEKSHFH